MTSLDYTWMMERINRCYEQLWEISEQILAQGGNVILDLGFTTKEQRKLFSDRAANVDTRPELHYLDAPRETRKKRIAKRNLDKHPGVYAFEVTDVMFNFMEPRFEVPDSKELINGCKVDA